MKNKFILAALLLVFAVSAKAQEGHKPVAGNVTAEVGLNLENGTFLQGGNLRFRYFMAEETAIRIGLSGSHSYNKIDDNTNQSTSSFRIAPGIEKHFAGTDRLSPYVGAELPIGFNSSSFENATYIYRGTSNPSTSSVGGAGFNIGLNGVAGVDYYFATHFYAGFEFGAGFRYMKNRDVERETKSNGEVITTKGYHSTNFSPFATGGLRLGFVF